MRAHWNLHTALRRAAVLGMAIIIARSQAYAQHPIDVERAAARGEFFEALVQFEKLPTRRATTPAIIAAARSAWALGLNNRAAQEFDRSLKDRSLAPRERGRILITRGIIEFQANRYQEALLYAERAIESLADPSPLRAQAWMLWGQGLSRLGAHGLAEDKFLRALKESDPSMRTEIGFYLAECETKLGKWADAREHLEKIPLTHETAPKAIRYLAEGALQEKDYKQVIFWLSTGRKRFADQFLDSWVDYALVTASISLRDSASVNHIVHDASARYAPSDYWLNLLQAAAEAYYVEEANINKSMAAQES